MVDRDDANVGSKQFSISRDELVLLSLLNKWTISSALDLTWEKRCNTSNGELNPHAALRTVKQQRESIPSLNDPVDTNLANMKLHTN